MLDPITIAFLTSIAAGLTTDATKAIISKIKAKDHQSYVSLIEAAEAKNEKQAATIINSALGSILIEVSDGSFVTDGAKIYALCGVKIDHEQGLVDLANTTVAGKKIELGGTKSGRGQTHLRGNSSALTPSGTGVITTGDASVVLTGNATIKIT